MTEDLVLKTPTADDSPLQFAKLLHHLLDRCNEIMHGGEHYWTLDHLANFADVSSSHVKEWAGGQVSTVIPKGDVYMLCWALCGMMDGSLSGQPAERLGRRVPGRREPVGRRELGSMLNRLLRAAGYRPIEGRTGYDSNLVWERLSGVDDDPDDDRAGAGGGARFLNVGYFDTWPLFRTPDADARKAGVEDKPAGIGREFTDRLAALMGVEIRWTRLDKWADLILGIKERRIDIVAPQMAIPRRLFGINFAQELPDLACGVNALLHRDCLGFVMTGEHIGYAELKESKTYKKQFGNNLELRRVEEAWLGRLKFEYVPRNVGEYAWELFRPPHSEGDLRVGRLGAPQEGETRREWIDVIESPWEDPDTKEVVRCFVTGQLRCYESREESVHPLAKQAEYLLPLESSLAPMPYAYGVAYTEDRLLEVVNQCMKIIYNDTIFVEEVYGRYMRELTESRIYRPAAPRRPAFAGGQR